MPTTTKSAANAQQLTVGTFAQRISWTGLVAGAERVAKHGAAVSHGFPVEVALLLGPWCNMLVRRWHCSRNYIL